MLNWLKRRPKKVKILAVVNGDASIPIDYWNKIDVSIETEVRAACNDLAIPADTKTVNDIAIALSSGETYWLMETWGFQIIDVDVK